MEYVYGFRVVSRPVHIGDYEAILRGIEIWPDRLTEGLTGWEEYGDEDVLSVSLRFEVLDGSPEALRPRAAYLGFWPYDQSLRRVFGKPEKTRPTLRIDQHVPLGGHFRVAAEKSVDTEGGEAIEHWGVGRILSRVEPEV